MNVFFKKKRLSWLIAFATLYVTLIISGTSDCGAQTDLCPQKSDEPLAVKFNYCATLNWNLDSSFRPPFRYRTMTENDTSSWSGWSEMPLTEISDPDINRIEIESYNGKILSQTIVVEDNGINSLAIAIPCAVVLIIAGMMLACRCRKKSAEGGDEQTAETKTTEERKPNRAQKFENVTILFADIQGFTKIAEHMNQDQLIDELDRYFISFDEIVEKYNIEKIKTIGDAYMCAGGIPDDNSANPIEVVLAALEIMEYVKQRQASSDGFWNIRIGVHTGPVISGVLGFKKRAFDIGGDSVNIASRMESSSEAGRINMTGETYNYIKDIFDCRYRGKMPVKYKGEIDMYFVENIKAEYASPQNPNLPNQKLLRKLQLMKYSDLENFVYKQLMKQLAEPTKNEFKRFLTRVETLSRHEGLSDWDVVRNISVAVIYFVTKENQLYNNYIGTLNDYLKRMHFSIHEISDIKRTAGKCILGKLPENKCEEIIHDAEYEFVGSKDIVKIIMERHGIESHKKTLKKDIVKKYIKIISDSQLYTASAQALAEVDKEHQLKTLQHILRIN